MSKFQIETYYDKEIGGLVNKYYVDGNEVLEDDYYAILDLGVEEFELDFCDDEYDDIPDEVFEIAHIIDEYANIIESSECGCRLRDVLLEVFFKGIRIGEQNYKDWLLESIQNND